MTTPSSGDKAYPVQAADGVVPLFKLTAADSSGDMAVPLGFADGKVPPMKVTPIASSGERGFPVQCADGKVTLVKEEAAAGTLYLAGDIQGNYDPKPNVNYKAVLWDGVLNRWRCAGSDGGLRMSYPQYFMNGSDGTLYHYGRNLLSGWGNITYTGIVKWSDEDEDWSNIFASVTGNVGNYCFGMIENTTDVFTILGDNTDVDGTSVNMVFTWDKTDDTITNLGTGLPVGWSYIQLGAYHSNGELIVSGNNEVYKLSGGVWSDITPYSGGSITDMTVYNGDIIICGTIADISGDTSKKYLFKYDGSSWTLFSKYVFGGYVANVKAIGDELYVYCATKLYNGNPITITCMYDADLDEFIDIPDESQHLWDKSAGFPKGISEYSGILDMQYNRTAFDTAYYDPYVPVTHAGGDSNIAERPDLFNQYYAVYHGFSNSYHFKFSSYPRSSVIGAGGIAYDTDTQNFSTVGRLGPMEVEYTVNDGEPDEWTKYSTNICSGSNMHPSCVWMGTIGSDICALRFCYVKAGTYPADKVYYYQVSASVTSLNDGDYSVEGWQLVKLNDAGHWEEYIEGKGVFKYNFVNTSDNPFDTYDKAWGHIGVHIKDNGKVIINGPFKEIDGVDAYGLVELDTSAETFTPIGPTNTAGDFSWASSIYWNYSDNYYCWNYQEGPTYEVICTGTEGSNSIYWDEDTRNGLGGMFLYRTKRDGAGGWTSVLPMNRLFDILEYGAGNELPFCFENPNNPGEFIFWANKQSRPSRESSGDEVWYDNQWYSSTIWRYQLDWEFPVSLLDEYNDGAKPTAFGFGVDIEAIRSYCFHDDKIFIAGDFNAATHIGDTFGLFSWDGVTIQSYDGLSTYIDDVSPASSNYQSNAYKAFRMISLNDRLWLVGGQFLYQYEVQTSDAPVTKPTIFYPLYGICYLDTENNRLWMDKMEFEPKDGEGESQVHGYGTAIYPMLGNFSNISVFNVSL